MPRSPPAGRAIGYLSADISAHSAAPKPTADLGIIAFGDDGILYKNETIDVRLKWRAIDAVEDLGWIVLFRYGQQNVFIPSRVFSDDAARQAFVAATAARIKAAAESNKGPNQAWPA